MILSGFSIYSASKETRGDCKHQLVTFQAFLFPFCLCSPSGLW